MPPTSERGLARRLGALLAALPVVVEEAACVVSAVALPSYPDGARPSSVVALGGAGVSGRGENVAWTDADHRRFATLAAAVPRGRHRLGAWTTAMADRVAAPYDRAALEAAAIDLALRQHATNLFRLCGVRPRPVRYVVSFARCADPAAEVRRLRAGAPGLELKIDADAAWDDGVLDQLAALGGVAVLDWKLGGTPADHERAHRALPEALIEDPRPGDVAWAAGLVRRVSFDAPVGCAGDVATLPVRPAAVNLKPARMGGVFEALAAAAACAVAGIAVYLGGMFEVDVGRRQLAALAALLCPDGPNDIAPLARGDAPAPRPLRLVVDADAVGFGSDAC